MGTRGHVDNGTRGHGDTGGGQGQDKGDKGQGDKGTREAVDEIQTSILRCFTKVEDFGGGLKPSCCCQ